MNEKEQITPIARKVASSKNILFLDKKNFNNPDNLPAAAYNVELLVNTGKDISYYEGYEEKDLRMVSAKDLKMIYQNFKTIMSEKGREHPRLFLTVKPADEMAFLFPEALKVNKIKASNSPSFEIATGAFNNQNHEIIKTTFHHEKDHGRQYRKLKRLPTIPEYTKGEVQSDSAMLCNAGYEKAVLMLRKNYHEYLETQAKFGLKPDIEASKGPFYVSKESSYPSYPLRVLMLDLLKDKRNGDDHLYNKVKKSYNF